MARIEHTHWRRAHTHTHTRLFTCWRNEKNGSVAIQPRVRPSCRSPILVSAVFNNCKLKGGVPFLVGRTRRIAVDAVIGKCRAHNNNKTKGKGGGNWRANGYKQRHNDDDDCAGCHYFQIKKETRCLPPLLLLMMTDIVVAVDCNKERKRIGSLSHAHKTRGRRRRRRRERSFCCCSYSSSSSCLFCVQQRENTLSTQLNFCSCVISNWKKRRTNTNKNQIEKRRKKKTQLAHEWNKHVACGWISTIDCCSQSVPLSR